jgi:hypothetical protein
MNKNLDRKKKTSKKAKNFQELDTYVGKVIALLETKKYLYDEYAGINKIRPSFLKPSKNEFNGSINHPVIEPYSSEDDCNADAGREGGGGADACQIGLDESPNFNKEPTVKEVCEYIFDFNTIMKIV